MLSNRHVYRLQSVVVVLLIGFALTGCATTTTTEKAHSAPKFEGPWAAEFTSAYKAAKSDFVRGVLKDGKITDQEFSEMTERFKSCLDSSGITFEGFKEDGSYDTSFPPGSISGDEAHKRIDACSSEAGEDRVGALHSWLQRNPQKLDENQIMASCLVSKGAVDASFTAKEYAKDVATLTFPFLNKAKGEEALSSCESDPLGLISGG